jgi:hypothetical protein
VRAPVTFALVGLTLLACSAQAVPPPTPSETAVSGLRAAAAVELALDEIASDAVDVAELRALLDDAGFQAAVSRSYSKLRGAVRRVDVRVVRFATEDGAERYLAWLESHAEDIIGDASPATGPEIPRASLFLHLPGGCCPKETPVVLAAWRERHDVVRVLVAGPSADVSAAAEYVADVQRWWEVA